MKWYFLAILFLGLTLFSSCSDLEAESTPKAKSAQKSKAKPAKKKTAKPAPRKKPKSEKITNKNVREKLLAYGEQHPESKVLIKTRLGNITVKLYEDTPMHRANFLMLVKKKYYDDTFFYRVIPDFVIQGGNTDDDAAMGKRSRIGTYTIPPEVKPEYIHKRGAIAMARVMDDKTNPNKHSSPYNFYIVDGFVHTDDDLYVANLETGYKQPPAQANIYKTIGGIAALDSDFTVFGEVIKGFDVIDKISEVERDNQDWPKENVVIEMEVLK